jgi:hypothetical protein
MYRDKYLAQVIERTEPPTERELLASIFGNQVPVQFACTLPQVGDEVYADPEHTLLIGVTDSISDDDPTGATVRALDGAPAFEQGNLLFNKQLSERIRQFYADCPEFV